ncbi:fasciclin domain-containing protein [Tenggerimyces flavus]|uniref:Fasciclin domain-containing protein n=1 Tax=Tenggerimyces flavus TaxID=1708749 RepID=A0ABV7Y8Z9_9ACTN|nr:fasciclin domain-containing protein [Tenggerimyces flavus]MBM7785911.1 putative surface protein with fasciclin (FAS1) repeats [Tenggerimyces flavus]
MKTIRSRFRFGVMFAGVGLLAMVGAACGNTAEPTTQNEPAPTTSASSEAPDAMGAGMVGAGCAGYADQVPTGPGSVEGMAKDPVAVAASNNPLLKTLVSAVSGKLNPKVNLVDTLNGAEFTVFAPVDDAFAKIDAKTIETLKTDDKMLSKILTYHVVAGQLAPDAVVGDQKTVEGGTVKVTGTGDDLKVNDASVICGGVKTANATVYLIDTVLTPPADSGAMGAGMVGSGCAGYADQVPTGPGSVEGMAKDPVAVAASNNPLLKTLVSAVSGKLNPKVNLVDTLNGAEFTVFAPVDDAFAKIDAKTIETLKTDDKMLSKILTYHVIAGQLAPDAVVGDQKTVQGGTVTVTGSGDALKVNDASVICGGVKTANATVYLIDTVLMPM